jgi:3-isopropylmalate dehydrogenase
MAVLNLAVLEGDGIGPAVTREALKVLEAVADRFGFIVATHRLPLGADHYLSTGEVLPANAIEEMRRCDAILLGAMGDPRVTPGILERGIIIALRTAFRQAVNVRPVRLLPGMTSPLRDLKREDCDFVIVRENTEGLYAGGGSTAHAGTADAVAIQTSITTTRATEATLRYAFELARTRRKHLTLCHKTNILLDAGALWTDALTRLAFDFPDVEVDYVHADAMCLHMIASPGRFDVVVTDNLFGDILSDLGAALQGGLGTAASGNLNLDGSAPSMFEPVHGSAPDIAGTSRANPVAAVLSVAMCLQTLGYIEAAAACEHAVAATLVELQGSAEPIRTEWVGDRIADRIRRADTDAAKS